MGCLHISPCTHGVFEVYIDGNSHRVELQKSICSCGKWQISGIPCEHAYAAMMEAGLDVEDYVSGFFLTDMWRDTYETATKVMRGPKYWMGKHYRLVTAPPEPIYFLGERKMAQRNQVSRESKGNMNHLRRARRRSMKWKN